MEGFCNWKKATECFRQHEASHTHHLSVNHFSSQTKPVDVQLVTQRQEQQKTAARCLEIIATAVRYLAHEGLALRGHTDESGHHQELLKLPTADVPELQLWLDRHNIATRLETCRMNFWCWCRRHYRESLCMSDITAVEPMQFSVVVDGTRDRGDQSTVWRQMGKTYQLHWPIMWFVFTPRDV